jgi:hypothetical protein
MGAALPRRLARVGWWCMAALGVLGVAFAPGAYAQNEAQVCASTQSLSTQCLLLIQCHGYQTFS